jgi:hypothetical protein
MGRSDPAAFSHGYHAPARTSGQFSKIAWTVFQGSHKAFGGHPRHVPLIDEQQGSQK